jgi:very-short-patch-repair endonuclease
MESELESILGRQDALVTWAQMLEIGLSPTRIRALVRTHVIRRIRPHTYVLVGAPSSWEQMLRSAILCAGDSAVASHSAAARVWRFSHRPEERLEITVPGWARRRIRGVVVHRSTRLQDDDVVQMGIPRTSFERTLCDCTATLTGFQLGRVLDDGLRRGLANLERLAACAERLESGPGRHMAEIRALLAARTEGFHPGGSNAELRVLRVLRRARLPLPQQQVRVSLEGRRYVLDFAWPERRILAEYYGLSYHSGASAVAYDSERLTALAADGWLPLVFTDATSDRQIVERTAAALVQRQVWSLTGTDSP